MRRVLIWLLVYLTVVYGSLLAYTGVLFAIRNASIGGGVSFEALFLSKQVIYGGSLLAQIVAFLVFFFWETDERPRWSPPRRTWSALIGVLATVVSMNIIFVYGLALVNIWLPDYPGGLFEVVSFSEPMIPYGVPQTLVFLLLFGVVTPVVEEWLFRGLVLTQLRKVYSTQVAVFAQALLFAVAHLDYRIFPIIFLFGVLLAWIKIWSQSLTLPILAHATHNMVYFLFVQFYVSHWGTRHSSLYQTLFATSPLGVGIPTLFLVLGGLWLILNVWFVRAALQPDEPA